MSRDDKNKELRGQIAYYLETSGYTKKQLALKLGISPASLYNKLNNPDSFTFGEVRKLSEWMGLNEDKLKMVV